MSEDSKNIKSLLTNVLRNDSRLSKKYQSYNVEQIYRDTFGAMISNYTTDVKYKNGVLTVYISSSALKQELQLTQENVINKMNAALKYCKVQKLIIR